MIEKLTSFFEEAVQPGRRTVFLAVTAALLVGLLHLLGFFSNLELYLVDKRFNWRYRLGDVPIDSSVITVDWDEMAIQTVGRWPWTWEKHAILFETLKYYGAARAAVVNNHFSSEELPALEPNAAAILQTRLLNAVFAGDTEALAAAIPRYNERFARSLEDFGHAYLAVNLAVPGAEESLTPEQLFKWKRALALERSSEDREAVERVLQFGVPARKGGAPYEAIAVRPPVLRLCRVVKGVGFNRIMHDPDGVVRRTPAMMRFRGRDFPAIGVVLAAEAFGVPQKKVIYRPGHYIEFPGAVYPNGRKVRLPIDKNGMAAVNWPGPYHGTIPHLPFKMIRDDYLYRTAKSVLKHLDLSGAPEELNALYGDAVNAIIGTGLCNAEEAQAIASQIFIAHVAQFYNDAGSPFSDFLDYTGGEDPDGTVRLVWDCIRIGKLTEKAFLSGNTSPKYEDLLAEAELSDTPEFRETVGQVLFAARKGTLDLVRPFFFPPPLRISLPDGTVQKLSLLSLEGKSVFIGLTASALNALNPTPFQERYEMLGMQPALYTTIMTGRFIHYPSLPLVLGLIVFYSFLTSWLVFRKGTAIPLFSSLLLLTAHLTVSLTGFFRLGWVIPIVAPSLAITGTYLGGVGISYLQALRERRRVRGLFSAMVSPEVLRMIEANPELLALSGERRDATMFSSDVSGFTTISEGVTAQELAAILNVYLTPMSNIIMKYDGYVDKYEGDAIKASFGIPLPDEHHPWKGVCQAMEQQVELDVIKRMILLKYGVSISARMGVNSGIVSAGNMGSEQKKQFSVLGAEVAIAEELEPINKLYDTWIAFGEETERRARSVVLGRMLDIVPLGPAEEPRRIFEPLGWNREAYLAYWRNRPVPSMILEGLRKLPPEKALGYLHYYENHTLPDSALKSEILQLFRDLKDPAMEAMKQEHRIDVGRFLEMLTAVEKRLRGYSAAVSPPTESSPERIRALFANWRERIATLTQRLTEVSDRIGSAEREELLTILDTLEKRVNSFEKRISFTAEGDAVGLELARNLSGVLEAAGRGERFDLVAADRAYRGHRRVIRTAMENFVARFEAPEKAREYHEFIADHCRLLDEHRDLKTRFEAAWELYAKKRWDEAEAAFRDVLENYPDDPPSLKYLERIARERDAAA
ncbi:MAG: CHASE2 domain-containing protein [Candidatus Hydrogenedentota bacterium]|nr:MAG: CHASE2 domain-containing protein [Candidatus Hydrogenedentota bacterium]